MANPTPTETNQPKLTEKSSTQPSPWRCLIGSAIAIAMSTGSYLLTSSIAQTFASKPIQSDNVAVINITIAVRTLVVGISTLATGVFSLVALGLIALAVQLSIQQLKNQPSPPQN